MSIEGLYLVNENCNIAFAYNIKQMMKTIKQYKTIGLVVKSITYENRMVLIKFKNENI